MSALDAVSIYDEFKELTPIGKEGDMFVQELAERLVDVDLSQIQGPSKRINVTIPAGVLARIDAAANAKGENRSQFLTNAAIERISS